MNSYNRKMAETAARRRKLILKLSEKLTFSEIGKKLKISPQRVHQLYKEEVEKNGRPSVKREN